MKVLIGVLTFRREEALLRLLDSLMDSGNLGGDVVVFNNAPEPLELQHPRLLTVCHPGRGGVAAGRNAILEYGRSRGYELVAMLDDDEIASPAWLEELLTMKARYPDACAIAGPVQPTGIRAPLIAASFQRAEHGDGASLPSAGAGNLLLDLQRIEPFGPFDENFDRGGEDTEFTLRVVQGGGTIRWAGRAVASEPVTVDRQRLGYAVTRYFNNGRILARCAARPEPLARLVAVGVGCFWLPLCFFTPRAWRRFLDLSVRNAGFLVELATGRLTKYRN